MGQRKTFHVYIMTNRPNGTLYIGVTGNIAARVHQHRIGKGSSFTRRYNLHNLVYTEETHDVNAAITREKQLKAGSRAKKVALIESINPDWQDLMPI